MNFGNALKTIRLLRNLDQKAVATLAHMDERTLRRIEANRTRILAEQVKMFARIFQVDVKLIYDIAYEEVSLQDVAKEAKLDRTVVSQDPEDKAVLEHLLSRIDSLEALLRGLEKAS